MKQKWMVWLSYGVYVDTDQDLNPDDEVNDYAVLKALAVKKMLDHGLNVLVTDCDMEYEDMTEEFANG